MKPSQTPYPVQVIHQIVIPENPQGLIGEKVVFNEKYLKYFEKRGIETNPVPPCGYFTITKAVLQPDGNVMVTLCPNKDMFRFNDGTNTALGNLKKYVPA